MSLTLNHETAQGLSSEQIQTIRAELSAILASDNFATSTRCQEFLSCVVELTLAGNYESLTERFLGAKLFGRAIDYETATDSIVRVRANDVRRRLAQFYSTHSSHGKVRIEVAAGRYIPEFHWVTPKEEKDIPEAPAAGPPARSRVLPDTAPEASSAELDSRPARSKGIWILGAFAVSALIIGFACFFLRQAKPDNFESFWQPVLQAPGQPVLNLPTTDTFQLTMNPQRTLSPLGDLQPGQSFKLSTGNFIGFHDWHVSVPVLQATLSVAQALDHKGRPPLVRVGTDMRRDELRGHPVIAIGSFSNPWAEANVNGLRFTFDRGSSDREAPRIRDAQNPQRTWSLPHTYPEPQQKDYAIITRTFDPVTGEPFISLAGLHSFGNQIAGEFVSQEASWNEIARRAPRGWQKMNLQILLEADIVGTTPSSPRVIDVYFWK